MKRIMILGLLAITGVSFNAQALVESCTCNISGAYTATPEGYIFTCEANCPAGVYNPPVTTVGGGCASGENCTAIATLLCQAQNGATIQRSASYGLGAGAGNPCIQKRQVNTIN
jgi:hypothetical protein